MADVIYLSYLKSEGVMHSLGMELVVIDKNQNIIDLLRRMKRQGVQIVFVSESVYLDFTEEINSFDKDFDLTVSVLTNSKQSRSVGNERLDHLFNEVLGMKSN